MAEERWEVPLGYTLKVEREAVSVPADYAGILPLRYEFTDQLHVTLTPAYETLPSRDVQVDRFEVSGRHDRVTRVITAVLAALEDPRAGTDTRGDG